ncbi:hypothetical protein NE619_06600 [Anaerovorax odorimutans]|uniref:Uncharacterized protein n=1 Tax=Anaerovorax odorimutans TaxID=109327 RepID=A0ABT1RMI6_9FIRM|nr:hypothetical protein [Anaerovorax odorimutans]MCQ4636393.1 hypothetical protein [Anaerovorax odorimutans]
MGDGVIGKFIYFWIFILGGLLIGKMVGLTNSAGNVVMLCICLTITYLGWLFIQSRLKRNAAARKAEPTPRHNNRHGKKKK